MNDERKKEGSGISTLSAAPDEFLREWFEKRHGESFEAGAAPLDRRKIAEHIYQLLTTSSGEKSKPVPGTPFSEEGVATLMSELTRRTQNEGAFGAKAAAAALRFLAPKDDDAPHIHGASVNSLQMIAQAAQRLGLTRDDAPPLK